MKFRDMVRSAAFLCLTLGTVWAVPGFAISKEFNQTYPLQAGGSFELQNVNGAVEVQGWDRDDVEVHAVKTAKQNESDLERVAIEVTAKPNSVAVVTHYPQNEGVEVAVPRRRERIGRLHAARKRERSKHKAYRDANASHLRTHGQFLIPIKDFHG